MKFAIISDIHIGDYRTHKGIYRKATPHAEKFLKDVLNYKKLYFSFDKQNFRFIFLFTKRLYPSKEIKLDSSQLKWLKKSDCW